MHSPATPSSRPAATWKIVLAFALLYTSWGTTFLAIHEGVKHFPPALFGGARVCMGGLVLLGLLALRGERLRLPWRELPGALLASVLLFVGGNGLITIGLGEKTMPSGLAAVLGSTTTLFMGLLSLCWPRGDRLAWCGWLGLLGGLAGVLILLPLQQSPREWVREPGPLLVLASAFFWALGSLLVRHRRRRRSPLVTAAHQMALGGAALMLAGVGLGEWHDVTPERFTPVVLGTFFYLLVFGSLVGFVAYTYLLHHVSAALAGTYAYINPIIAIFIGWLLAGEEIRLRIVGGMAVILISVALVRLGSRSREGRAEFETATQKHTEPSPARRAREAAHSPY